ncbi:MAG: hypothetical protein CMG66_00825 [Candidatus Marinimicrobia bacterium]|nr:hypothetical protein [Candidatus Neomarinimicrobiota bacterium]|tara:strand:- start:26744 stop:27814 length:1071 start_codon:yes stop_codon:yes gene_type:complete
MKRYFLLFLTLFVLVSCYKASSSGQREFQFTYTVALEPTGNKSLELWLPVPKTSTVQTISNLELDTQGLEYEIKDEEKHGNKYVYIYSKKGIDEAKEITMKFDVVRSEHQNVAYDNVEYSRYLKASSMVPVGNIFSEIIKENNLNGDDMRGLYDFVLNGMHYGKPTDDKDSKNYKYIHGGKNPKTGQEWLPNDITYGLKKKTKDELVKSQNKNKEYAYGNGNSLYACDIGVGNCTDYHSYFISLARTMDVPSRFHMGFSIPEGKSGKVGGYHCWADYYVENEGWLPVDISEADKDPSKVDYFFGTATDNRVEMMVGRDFELFGYNGGIMNFFIYPVLEINNRESKKFTKKFSYKEL